MVNALTQVLTQVQLLSEINEYEINDIQSTGVDFLMNHSFISLIRCTQRN